MKAYLEIRLRKLLEADIHPSQNGPTVLLWPYRNKTTGQERSIEKSGVSSSNKEFKVPKYL